MNGLIYQLASIFQSTLPRGERPLSPFKYAYLKDISIHAPTRGATYIGAGVHHIRGISIHAPTRGATVIAINSGNRSMIFQSTLPRGERPYLYDVKETLNKFQSTLPRGERLMIVYHCPLSDIISIHAPTRGATYSFW